ncbi:CD2-associated protein isoform X2 [Hyperolius riggenbachi]|uniref:CD2-associated protein isoform X2 n=1 Tax=Hyperolius riggenbachi TaxID=752182 RepID=UPI0035A38029
MSMEPEVKKDPEPKEDNSAKKDKPVNVSGNVAGNVSGNVGGNVASLVQRMSVYGIPGIGGPPPQNRSFKKKSKKRQCKVLFEYIPQNEDELELRVGEILDITEEVEEGWWSGTCSGRSGLFPSNFVKELELSDDGESQESSEDTEPPAAPAGASPASPVLSPTNNVEGSPIGVAQPKKVMGVGFGDIFKEGSVRLKPRLPVADPEIKKPEKPSPTPQPAAKVSRTTSSELPRTEVDGKPKAKETCRALFPYEGSNDELSFKEGDVIQLISKDTGDPGWWKGELNGKEGVFPDNFAAIIPESEKEKPKKPPPPMKSAVPKPDLHHGDKKFTPTKSDEREKDEKPSVDLKPSLDPRPFKPAAPVPPKKPSLVTKSNSLSKPAVVPPKRPEKPAFPTPISKPNGESPRPKSEFEPFSKTKMDLEHIFNRPKSQEVESSFVKTPRETAPSALSFDDLLPISDNLSHPTASRPKMTGKRPPTRFNSSPGKDQPEIQPEPQKPQKVAVHHEEEVDSAKTSTPEVKKPPPPVTTTSAFTPTTSAFTPTTSAFIPTTSAFTPTSFVSKPSFTPISPLVDVKPKFDLNDGKRSEVEELRAQVNELLTIVDALRKEHRKEIDKIKRDLEDEKLLRSSLEMEVDKLKKAIHQT